MMLKSVLRFVFDNIGNPLSSKKNCRYDDLRRAKKLIQKRWKNI